MRSLNYPAVENSIDIWLRQQQALNYPISAQILIEKDKYFDLELELKKF